MYLNPKESSTFPCKSFIRPYLDNGDILYDKAFNACFHQKIESIQYNACLAITGAIRGSLREKIYQELGLESLQHGRWYRKPWYFYKIYNKKSPDYLFQLILPKKSYTPLETLIIFHSSNFVIIFSKICFFRPLLLNGTS